MKVGVIGAGTMGQGIAKAFAQVEGYEVALCDIKQEWADGGKEKIAKGYARLVEKGKMTQETLKKLAQLLEQDQFELILPENVQPDETKTEGEGTRGRDIRLVYLMNDAAESFLVFHQVKITGSYQSDYEGELDASLQKDGDGYVLSVWQGECVVTLFFKQLELEVHLYEYSGIGHFWMKGDEDLRVLEYQIAILRDKSHYLGEEYCTEKERQLASLADFPPLNACSYPAVPKQYRVGSEDLKEVAPEAIKLMEAFAVQAKDRELIQMLRLYECFPKPVIAKQIAKLLKKKKHEKITQLISECLKEENKKYPRRTFSKEADKNLNQLLKKAEAKRLEFKKKGIRAEVFREEPFTMAQDDLDFHVYLLIWQNGWHKKRVTVEEIK